jgi:hypothetical protein
MPFGEEFALLVLRRYSGVEDVMLQDKRSRTIMKMLQI